MHEVVSSYHVLFVQQCRAPGSNEQGKLTDQYGYSQIYNRYPNLKPDVNTFRAKKKGSAN